MTRTFYDVLGVDEDADAAGIRAAYRERVKATHPDVSDAPDARERFEAVARAEAVLGNEAERARYDRLGHETYLRRTGGVTASGADAGGGERPPWSRPGGAGRERADGAPGTARNPTGDGRGSGHPKGARDAGHSTGARVRDESRRRRRPGARQDPEDGHAGYAVHDWTPGAVAPPDAGREWSHDLVVFTASMTLLYPLLLFSTTTAAFPAVVNLIVGACTVLSVGYLLTLPRVALVIFGLWSAVAPVGLVWLPGVTPVSAPGLFVLGACWLPLGYAAAVAWTVDG